MRYRVPVSLATLTIIAAGFVAMLRSEQATPRATQPSSTTCDRRCLLQFLTDYTKALTDNESPEA